MAYIGNIPKLKNAGGFKKRKTKKRKTNLSGFNQFTITTISKCRCKFITSGSQVV